MPGAGQETGLTRRRAAWGGGVVLVIALLVVGFQGFTTGLPGHVARPAQDAPPDVVVRTWLRAIDRGDWSTARALMVPRARYVVGAWRQSVRSVEHVDVGGVEVDADRATVVVEYDLKYVWGQTTFTESTPGDHFTLVREGGRWLLSDEPSDGI